MRMGEPARRMPSFIRWMGQSMDEEGSTHPSQRLTHPIVRLGHPRVRTGHPGQEPDPSSRPARSSTCPDGSCCPRDSPIRSPGSVIHVPGRGHPGQGPAPSTRPARSSTRPDESSSPRDRPIRSPGSVIPRPGTPTAPRNERLSRLLPGKEKIDAAAWAKCRPDRLYLMRARGDAIQRRGRLSFQKR
jgi:hypothetical protein